MDQTRQTFISYHNSDRIAAEAIAHQLRASGIEPWLDRGNLIPGNPWQEDLEHAVSDCQSCCILVGPSGIGPWQNAEMRALIDRRMITQGFRVIPVLLPGAQRAQRSTYPAFLTQTTWVEFNETIEEPEPFRRLLAGGRGVAPGAPPPLAADGSNRPSIGVRRFDLGDPRWCFCVRAQP